MAIFVFLSGTLMVVAGQALRSAQSRAFVWEVQSLLNSIADVARFAAASVATLFVADWFDSKMKDAWDHIRIKLQEPGFPPSDRYSLVKRIFNGMLLPLKKRIEQRLKGTAFERAKERLKSATGALKTKATGLGLAGLELISWALILDQWRK